MNLGELIAPIRVDDFKKLYFKKKSFAMLRERNPFKNLLTLSEIENKLNDGVGSIFSLRVVTEKQGRLPSDDVYTFQHLQNSFALNKKLVKKYLHKNFSVVMYNMSEINSNVSSLAKSIEEIFKGHHCDLHIYISPSASASKERTHRDQPQQKLYLQLIGSTRWTIYQPKANCPKKEIIFDDDDVEKYLEVDYQAVLFPGSVIYLPPKTFHRVEVHGGPRVSLSFLFVHAPKKRVVDRTHIDVTGLFKKNISNEYHLKASSLDEK